MQGKFNSPAKYFKQLSRKFYIIKLLLHFYQKIMPLAGIHNDVSKCSHPLMFQLGAIFYKMYDISAHALYYGRKLNWLYRECLK